MLPGFLELSLNPLLTVVCAFIGPTKLPLLESGNISKFYLSDVEFLFHFGMAHMFNNHMSAELIC